MPDISERVKTLTIEVLNRYRGGGGIGEHLTATGLKRADYYHAISTDPQLAAIAETVQAGRGMLCIDEAYEISTDETADPKRARVQADIRIRLAEKLNPDRYGARTNVQVEASADLKAALAEAKARTAALPGRDLGKIIDLQAVEIAGELPSAPTDKETGALPVEPLELARRRMFDE